MLMRPTGGKCSGRLSEGTEWKHCYGSEEGKNYNWTYVDDESMAEAAIVKLS